MANRPVPTALKIVRGTDQPCRVNPDEPVIASDKIIRPPHVKGAAKKFWEQFVPTMQAAGIISNADVPGIEALCRKYAEWNQYQKAAERDGLIIMKVNGDLVASPYISLAQKSFDSFRLMLTEFGMTPSSRTKVSTIKPKETKDEWSDL